MMNVETTSRARRLTSMATLLAPISWGTTYVTVTELLPAGRPLLVATMRVIPAGLLLLAVGSFVSPRWRPHGGEWRRTGLLAVCNFGLFFPLLIGAVYRLPGGVAAAVGGIQPLLVSTLSWLVTRRRPRPSELVVGAVAVVGVSLVVIRPGAGLDPVGLLLAVAANVSFAAGVVLTKRSPSAPNRLAATGWQMILAGMMILPFTLISEGGPPHLTWRNLGGFTYLSFIATAIAFVLWFHGVRKLPAAAPPLLGLAAPVTGALLGWLVLGQSLSTIQALGFAITVAAIARGATIDRSAVTSATSSSFENTKRHESVGSHVMTPPPHAHHLAGRVRPPCAAKAPRVRLRPLDPSDIDNVAALYERLSLRSKYLRFLTPGEKISARTVRHLASVDHDRHEAVGVFDDSGVLLGTAHYFRSLDDPTQAEIAVEVDDAHHRRGLGACLLGELARIARRSGITHFTATVLAENDAVISLLNQSRWPRVSRYDGPELTITMALSQSLPIGGTVPQ